ncbi:MULTISPECIES: RidA family protein [Mangrovibacter]|uniref:Enamine deaminase RidA (YjgF/YER057c/UK114 family) n=1 Tax=Mangrovibacter plantisponsor TaxID=451513 RepID=A0A317PWU2_9ENTR|nr:MULTISPECIES: RidA family protein [Mangrovibacter]KEA52955.1 endoribonuclease L-PSP [Mangrovibacter sp. MFB070]PWW07631.1 enamine deaminase RidA (YjgF/YER057c/UK114 family) [Mangrovibacter plantisponsor]
MTIVRLNAEDRWSDAIINNGTMYFTVVPEIDGTDAQQQVENCLEQIEAMLQERGGDKTRLIDVTVFLADKNDFAALNRAWDAWVVHGKAPVRTTVQALLMKPDWKVEIKVIAAI